MKAISLSAVLALLCLALTPFAAKAGPGNSSGTGTAQASVKPRIVAAGGVVTEIVYALGHSDLLVGVDTTSLFPESALKEKANVGYVRALSSEGLLSLNPSMIVAIESAGPPDVLKTVEGAGVEIVRVPEVSTPAGITEKIKEIAGLVGDVDKGAALAADTEKQFKSVDRLREKIHKPRRALFILSFLNGRATVGGEGTSADGIIALAGLQNSASMLKGWKPISDEALLEVAPDVIIAMNHGGPQAVTVDSILANPAFAATPAGKTKSILVFDGGYLLGFGPRTPDAARDLLLAAYPEIAKAEQGSDHK
jgi:iron complex transport system substrate-binding protein